MKRLLLLCLLLFAISTQAQNQRGLRGNYDTEKFPEISFVWNEANPQVLERSQFALTENDKDVDFRFAVLTKNNIPQVKKSIIFLWEDMASHREQLDFSRKLLGRFFNETPLEKIDRFNIGVFNRKKDSKNVLQPLSADFINDGAILADVVKSYKGSNEYFGVFPLQSDLYLAINNGIETLKKEPADRTGIIVVITAGLNIKAAGASTEMETVRKNALDAGIPIYVVKYPIFGDTPEVNTLAESTYGLSIVSVSVETALSRLQDIYKGLNSRCYGQDYRITFTTTAPQDGKSHPIRLSIDKVPQQIVSFTSPNMTFGVWVKENLWLFIALVVLVVVLMAVTVWLIRRNVARRNRAMAEKDAELQSKISDSDRKMDDIKRQHEEEKRRGQEEAAQKARESEEERLINLMRTKNLYPRLQCKVGNDTFNYTMEKPLITLGREKNNDVVLNNDKVSRHHAEIIFTGGGFDIIDNKSTNKVIVNGVFFDRITLKNGDIIGLGEAVITFYV